ncbi:hypothetical protein [Kitasatospora sp. NPDC059673]|uniref:hypothetical protein n=1 Tax=Kitasatospora sp. NPDC059673 TaxID=3346901 RepID=UPI00368021B0
MLVSAFLVLGATLGALAACDPESTVFDKQAEYAAQTTGLRTELEPMVRRFHRFGELESAQWVTHAPGVHPRSLPNQDQPYVLYAVLHLKPGQVKRLLDGRRSDPVAAPTFAADDLPAYGLPLPDDLPGGLPASLAPYVPTNAAWVAAPELNEVLVKAWPEVTVWFDPASDTAVVFSINPGDPDEAKEKVDTHGQTFLVTPSPFVLPS